MYAKNSLLQNLLWMTIYIYFDSHPTYIWSGLKVHQLHHFNCNESNNNCNSNCNIINAIVSASILQTRIIEIINYFSGQVEKQIYNICLYNRLKFQPKFQLVIEILLNWLLSWDNLTLSSSEYLWRDENWLLSWDILTLSLSEYLWKGENLVYQ